MAFGLLANHGIAGGSDSYGYVSQADLWLNSSLHIAQPQARQVPWPFGQWTLSPLGYRPSADQTSIVPVYAPGLAIVMAGFKSVAGQCGVAWVVPLCGGLLVLTTFGIGRRVFSDQIGAAGAFLVATSPTVLYMVAQPMSDVPVAAFWALATYGCLVDSRKGDVLAGLAAAVAILIRPNLVHIGALMALWLLVRNGRASGRARLQSRILLFALPVAIAGGGIALLNRRLYGSFTMSGYGPVETIYTLSSAVPNLFRYSWWLIQSQTPLALAAVFALFIPAALIMPAASVRGRWLLTLIASGAIAGYVFWSVFDAWWYLRFLLSAWPAICLTLAWLLTWPSGRTFTRAGTLAVACIGVYCLWFGYRGATFNFGEGDRRYVAVARLVQTATPPNSLIFSAQHSGSVRYYGSRMTLRYDWLSERWLDRSVEWLNAHGVHAYFLLDETEVSEFRRRFEGQNVLGHLNVAHIWEYQGSPYVTLYDPLQTARPGEAVATFRPGDVTLPACPMPAPPPQLVLKD